MESEKEFKEELKESLPIYKIAGIIIGVLLLIGVIFALITEFRPHETISVPKIVTISVPTPASTLAEPNLTKNITETTTSNISNITVYKISKAINSTANITNVTVITTPIPQSTIVPVNYSWSTVAINFPEKLKKISSNATSYHYIEILEGDGTPITNGEQFNIKFTLDDHHGRTTEIKQSFESNKWLIQLLLPNPGNYTLGVTITCADKNGHCKRFYAPGSAEKTFDFEVV